MDSQLPQAYSPFGIVSLTKPFGCSVKRNTLAVHSGLFCHSKFQRAISYLKLYNTTITLSRVKIYQSLLNHSFLLLAAQPLPDADFVPVPY